EPSPPSPQGHHEDDSDEFADSSASIAVTEPDTHKRLNASPATSADAVPSVEPIATITPSERSEAFALPLDILKDAVRPVGSLEELPDIHDLLPAIEPEDEPEEETENELGREPEDEPKNEPEDEPQIEPTELQTEPQIEPESASEAASAQPVLCSFDITESEGSAAAIPLMEPSTPELSTAQEKAPAVVADEGPLLINISITQSQPVDAVTDHSTDSPEMPDPSDSMPTPDAEMLEPVPETPVPEPVPEPASETASQPTESATGNVSTEDAIATEESTEDAIATKEGVVKLLFTLKEGNFHGYIAPDDGSKDVLFHQKYINADIFEQLERGVRVKVRVKVIEDKAYATRVDLL
ncbi:MAG: cold shock domain-containing protein, partial [Phormidesmis sp.]